jgi:HEPN domain-containing protein
MEEFLKWMEQAEEDLRTARILLEQRVYYASVFFCHQTVEKAFKSVLLRGGKDPGKVHSLPDLVEILEAEMGLNVPENIRSDMYEINPHYVVTRYPDAANGVPAKAYSQAKAQDILKKAEEVLEWSRQNLR